MGKILLVKPISRCYYTIAPNLGLGYLASSLERHGHDVAILDCDKERMTEGRFDSFLNGKNYDVIGFQLYTHWLESVKLQSMIARRHLKDALIVVGGPHASGDPRHTLEFLKDADIAILGEGEEAICTLAKISRSDLKNAHLLGAMQNIAYRDKENNIICASVNRIEDLDRIPMPAWKLMDPRTYPNMPHGIFARSFPIAPIVTSRGCPYQCTFCASFTMHGRMIRRRTPGAVLDEMEHLAREYGVKELHIEDDNFTIDKNYTKEILEGVLSRDLRIWIALPNGVRIDTLDEGLLKLMERSGCYSFGVGIESGSDKILKVMKKNLTTQHIEEKIRFIKRHTNIKITGFFLIGHPDETEEDINKTIDFALRLKLDRVSFAPLMPLPGSALYAEWKDKVDLDKVDWTKFLYYQFIPDMSPVSIKRLKSLLKKANLRFYMRPRIIMRLLKDVGSPCQLRMLLGRSLRILTG